MKVSTEVRVKKYCEGCGTAHSMQLQLSATELNSEEMIFRLRKANDILENAACPICKSKTATLSLFEEIPTRTKAQNKAYKNAKDFKL